jgi:hypothetical protein
MKTCSGRHAEVSSRVLIRPSATGDAVQATFTHRALDTFVVHAAAQTQPQLGRHPPPAIRAEALIVDLVDQLAEVESSSIRGVGLAWVCRQA